MKDCRPTMLPGKCLHEIFETRAREAPDRIALSVGGQQISYGDLDSRADRLARRLESLGVGPDQLVGLCVERGSDMIVGMLAILKSGGAYLPIDPAYPARRIHFLLSDSAVSIVVTGSCTARCLEGCEATVVSMDGEERGPEAAPVASGKRATTEENLAYAIYTSGSTGMPKGVLIEHRNVVRLFEQTHPWFRFDDWDVWTLFHSISFDFSVWEIWGALLYGGRLVIVPPEAIRSPLQLHRLLREQEVTVLNQTPSALRQLLAVDASLGSSPDSRLRLVILGGEALDVKLLTRWIAQSRDRRPGFVNMYGITETTVHVTYRRILEEDLEYPNVSPIGVPIPDLQIRLLDASGRETRNGSPGEIHVSGPGLARGYLNRPELTAERFVPGPNGTRVYRSGDQAVHRSNGELAYLGRSDDQMKVRGFRIEPGEIEACLSAHPEIATVLAAFQDCGDGDLRLVAYVLPQPGLEWTGEKIDTLAAELAKKATAELPLHMRPWAYRFVSEIPMTVQGKIDRKALPHLAGHEWAPHRGAPTPITATEQAIVHIAEQILQRKGIRITDDLFDIGGTSLAVVRIIRQTNQCFGVSLNGSELGSQATIARLAACVDAEIESKGSNSGGARTLNLAG